MNKLPQKKMKKLEKK